MKKQRMIMSKALIVLVFGLLSFVGAAQNPVCGPTVPYYYVNLSNNPDSVWSSPNISRSGQCCGAGSNDRCISFDVLLSPNTAGIQIDMIGADPAGSLYYDIDCIGNYPGGTVKCISGVGPHRITFCKPGNNPNIYIIRSVSKPIFPKDTSIRIGCSVPLTSYGITNTNTTWNSIFPGTPGQYNSYLSSTTTASPLYTPAAGAPAYVDYRVCGTPTASNCGFSFACDTVRVYNIPRLTSTITPNPAVYCQLGPGSGVNLSATQSGGGAPYSFEWFAGSPAVSVGTGNSYFATTAGSHTVQIKDKYYSATYCPAYTTTVSVTEGNQPVVNAGVDQTICANQTSVLLSGSVQHATGGVWTTSGTGTFSPGPNFTETTYIPSLDDISFGSVVLTLTSAGAGSGCPNSSDFMELTILPPVNVSLSAPSLSCHNSVVTLNASVAGGLPGYTYFWNTGATSSSIAAGQGVYHVQVTDSYGCKGNASVTLNAPSVLTLNTSSVDATCNGCMDGSATVAVSGGTSPYNYLWNPGGQTTPTTTPTLGYGIYQVTVTDANSCTSLSSVVVNEPRCLGFEVTAVSTNVSCNGGNDGTATSSVVGGTEPYQVLWSDSDGQTTLTAFNLEAGAYSVIAQDDNGCIQVASVSITQPTAINNTMTSSNVTAIGGNNGSASANPFGGTPGYTYSWDHGPTSQNINGLTAGMYYLDIIDAKSCVLQDSVLITEPPCNDLLLSVVTSNVGCAGGATGSAVAVVFNGQAPYSLTWSTGQTGPFISNLIAGSYSVTYTDGRNCTEFVNFTITQPSPLTLALAPTQPSCFGVNNGSIDATVSGGVAPYTYQWTGSSAATSEDIINLRPGTYTLSVTDANGCKVAGTITISYPTQLTASVVITEPTCYGYIDGVIDATVSGGTLPYFYSWSNGATSQDLVNIPAGGYGLTVTDANGCIRENIILTGVGQPDSLSTAPVVVACPVPGSGVALVTVSPQGGTAGGYQVAYNGGAFQPTGDYDALLSTGMSHTVQIRDIRGCTNLATINVDVNPEVEITNLAYGFCYPAGTLTENVTATITGGLGNPYQLFVDGSMIGTLGQYTMSLATGASYSITARDGNGCYSLPILVALPANFEASVAVTSNYNGAQISCFGASDGQATVSITGGTSPFNIQWNPAAGNQTTATASGLSAGTYSVTITDARGCVLNKNITITQPTAVSASASITSNYNGFNVSCFGGANGAAFASGAGGTGLLSYSWSTSPAQSTAAISNLTAGSYTVTVSDANGCSTSAAVTLNEPNLLTASASVASNYNGFGVSCNGFTDASINLTVTGGAGSNQYNWDNGATTEDLTNVGFGVYNVTISDINGCIANASVSVSQPLLLTASAVPSTNYNGFNITCNGATDGGINLTVNGGVPGYNFMWDNGFMGEDLSGIGAGAYSVDVTDLNGCQVSTGTMLTEPTALISSIASYSDYNGFGVSCFGYSDGHIDLTVSGGTGVYSYLWSNGAISQDLNNIPADTYSVAISDNNGCFSSESVTLAEPAVFSASAAVTTNYNGFGVSCNGFTDAAINLTVTGGAGNNQYQWDNGATTEDLSNVGFGVYNVTISDINGCIANASVLVSQPLLLTASAVPSTNYNGFNITCNGATDGGINLTVNGGVPGYNFMWDNGFMGEDLSGIGAGAYSVDVTDLNGCQVSTGTMLTEPTALISSIASYSDYNGFGVSCHGYSDGHIDLTVSGGTGVYSYLWSNGAISQDLNNIPADTYSVAISDNNGCFSSESVTLAEPAVFSASAAVTTNYNGFGVSCNGSTDAAINLTVTGGAGSNQYQWDNGATTEDLSNVGFGVYNVTISDINGCSTFASASVNQPSVLTTGGAPSTNFNDYNVSCFGGNNGAIDLIVNGGVLPYSYSWSNGFSFQDPSGLTEGTYSVIVTDNNGCTSNTSFTLTQPGPIVTGINSISNYNGFGVSCFGNNNGFVDVSVSGGTGVYTYVWDNGSTLQDLFHVGAGDYNLTVTDNNGCTAVISATITQPNLLVATIDAVSNYNGFAVSCYGGSDGNVSLNVIGGVSPVGILWDNGATTQNLINAPAGNYSVILTDANGCLTAQTVTLTQPSALQLVGNIGEPSCEGMMDAFVDLTVSGGVPTYNYSWSNGSTDEDLIDILAGKYTVILTDLNGCMDSLSVNIVNPNTLMIGTFVRDVMCFGLSNGSIDISIEGGTEPYTFTWSNGANSQNLTNVPAGTYDLQVTDAQGCGQDFLFTVNQPDTLTLTLISDLKPNGHNISYHGGSDGAIDAVVLGGVLPYTYTWSNGSINEDLLGLRAGTYTLLVIDLNGCVVSRTTVLTEPLPLAMPTGITPNGDGLNDNFVIHGIEAFPNNKFTVFNRWGNVVYEKENYANEWYGVNNSGDLLPDATYFVILEITDGDVLKGYVDLRTK